MHLWKIGLTVLMLAILSALWLTACANEPTPPQDANLARVRLECENRCMAARCVLDQNLPDSEAAMCTGYCQDWCAAARTRDDWMNRAADREQRMRTDTAEPPSAVNPPQRDVSSAAHDSACARCNVIVVASQAAVDACGSNITCLEAVEARTDREMQTNRDCVECTSAAFH